MPEQKTHTDFIQEVKEHGQNAKEVILQAQQDFQNCVVEQSQNGSKIIKEWANMVKNTPEELEAAYQYADENGLLQTYHEALMEGKAHRVCYRTFLVNEYIYNHLRAAQDDSQAVNDMLSELDGFSPDSPEG